MAKLLNVDKNAKTIKGQKQGFLTGILYLAPANLSGFEVCPRRSAGCTVSCLNTAGQGTFSNVQAARIRRTKEYFADKSAFLDKLEKEARAMIRKADRMGLTPVFRFNGTSDLPALAHVMARRLPGVQLYDYTKIERPETRTLENYHLTFSLSENNWPTAKAALEAGVSVTVVFDTKETRELTKLENKRKALELSGVTSGAEFDKLTAKYNREFLKTRLPETWRGFKVIDGDESDLRFLDEKGVIVGLRAKGKARKDKSGFVVRLRPVPEDVSLVRL